MSESQQVKFVPLGVMAEPAHDATFKPMVVGVHLTIGESTIAEVPDQRETFQAIPYSKLMERDLWRSLFFLEILNLLGIIYYALE